MNLQGLQHLPFDRRDYSHHKKFGTLGVSQLPSNDFTVYDSLEYKVIWGDSLSKICSKFGFTISEIIYLNPTLARNPDRIFVGQIIKIPARVPIILNQLDLDFCCGFASTELQNIIWGKSNDPLYQFSKIKQVRGEYKGYGANLRDGALSVVKYGSLLVNYAPYSHRGSQSDKTRDFLANWLNWPIGLDSQALKEKDLSFFNLDGENDVFDNIRSTLSMHRQERRAVLFGLFWHDEWTEAKNGIISEDMPFTSNGGGHAMAIIGQKTIGGKMYLVFQQSWGPTAGDKGFYYFPRSIVNQSYINGYGAFTFSNQDKSGLTGSGGILTFIAEFINNLLGNYAQ